MFSGKDNMNTVKLYNGVEMPAIMLGPGGPTMPKDLPLVGTRTILNKAWMKLIARPKSLRRFVDVVSKGICAGFRGIDFSAAYGRGSLIADAIEHSRLSRDEVFITGRISNAAQFSGRMAVEDQIKRILDDYRTDYVDILMFHWPVTNHYEETWRTICAAYEKGLARSIGVANSHPHHLKCLMDAGLKPMVNQFEVHPLFTQKDLIKYNQDIGIVVQSYTPIARMDQRLFRLPALNEIASAHNKSVVQVVLRWHIQQGLVPVVRANKPHHQAESISVFDFSLTADEMNIIDRFNINSRLRYDPDNCDFTIL